MATFASALTSALISKVAAIAVDQTFNSVANALGIQTQASETSEVARGLQGIQQDLNAMNQVLAKLATLSTQIQQQLTDQAYQGMLPATL